MKTSTIKSIRLESSSLRVDIRSAFDTAARHSLRLEAVGASAHSASTDDAFADADSDELRHRATRLRGCALHAAALAADLAAEAGRLEQAADVKDASVGDE